MISPATNHAATRQDHPLQGDHPLKGVIFDLDGTLIDSAPMVAGILNALRMEMGLAPLDAAAFVPWISLGGEQLIANALNTCEESTKQHLIEFRRRYATLSTPMECIYPKIDLVLTSLKNQGIALGIVTNKPRQLVDNVMQQTWLGSFFDHRHVIAGDDLPTRKPNPANLLTGISRFPLSTENAILVGDSTVDQHMARLAKVRFCFFSSGYDDGVLREEAHSIFADYDDFPHYYKPR